MSHIDKFVQSYQRQYDFWDSLARKAKGLIEAEIAGAGIQAIVTSRAKSVERVRMKADQRNRTKKYRSIEDLGRDIVDLAGVRIALYFPSQAPEVRKILDRVLNEPTIKEFPDPGHTRPGDPRFAGYRAQHFRGALADEFLDDQEERYRGAAIEVQVASVLMHAWSEVEHDLVYKPLDGELSSTEYALLDQLNGLVQSGEIALEELLRARDQRIAQASTPFRSHYELAEFLRSQPQVKDALVGDSTLGSLDVLFDFLRHEGLDNTQALTPLLNRLDGDFDNLTLTDQIVDQIVAGKPERYRAYRTLLARANRIAWAPSSSFSQPQADEAVRIFMQAWTELETVLLRESSGSEQSLALSRIPNALEEEVLNGRLTEAEFDRATHARRLRNDLLHSSRKRGALRVIHPERVKSEAEFLNLLTARLSEE